MAENANYGETEETILKMEEDIIEELQDVTKKAAEIAAKEDNFLKEMEGGKHPNKVLNSIADLEIFLDEDIKREIQDIETKIKSLDDTVSEDSKPHSEILGHLSNGLELLKKEEARFRSLLGKSEKSIEEAESADEVESIQKEIIKFEEAEQRQSIENVEEEIAQAKQIHDEYLKQAASG